MIDKDYLNGFEYENGKPISFRGYPVGNWRMCDKHGPYPTTYGDDLTQWPLRCGCAACFLEQQFEKKLESAMIPPRFITKTIDNFATKNEWQAIAKNTVKGFIDEFDQVFDKGRSLILCGRPGTGKTHLACAYANAVINQGHTALFTSVSQIIRQVRSSWGTNHQEETLKIFSDVDLLLIDEVGLQAGTENERQIIFNVINDRYNQMRPSVLISNLKQVEMKEQLGERVWDRLKENDGKVINLVWESYRK